MKEFEFRYFNNGIMQYDFGDWSEGISINEIFDYFKEFNIPVMQYLNKKDKNDKKIYEEDLVKINDEIYIIRYHDYLCYYGLFKKDYYYQFSDFSEEEIENIEVIGNTYEK
jgi:hypothetical protein